jgi:hypothetical protein
MSEAARNIVRFVCGQHDVIVICNPAAGNVIILASPPGQNAVEQALPDALQWLDPAADLYFPEGWQQTTVITGNASGRPRFAANGVEAEINLPTTPAESVENDPFRKLATRQIFYCGRPSDVFPMSSSVSYTAATLNLGSGA